MKITEYYTINPDSVKSAFIDAANKHIFIQITFNSDDYKTSMIKIMVKALPSVPKPELMHILRLKNEPFLITGKS